jgi:hypothetical protein
VKTHSLNSLSEAFEVDRSTMVKALRDVPGDAENTKGRPTWKTSTAAQALEAHRRKTGNSFGNADSVGSGSHYNPVDPRLASLYSQLNTADAALRQLPTLAKRRAAAINSLRPIIDQSQRMLKAVGKASGQDPVFTGLISDKLYLLALRGLEEPCGWTQNETWEAMNVETG